MPFDGLTIRALTRDFKCLYGARIDKIHQPEKDELVFSIRHLNTGSQRLVISANARWARLHLTDVRKPNPMAPPNFCMLLRKMLEGGKIKSIEQIDFDRIIHITIEALDDFGDWKEKILICEFMGKHSNIILINPETGLIIDAIKKYGSDMSSYREVLPGKEYLRPPGQGKLNPLALDWDQFSAAMWQQTGSLADALFKAVAGISPFSARQICRHSGLDESLPVEQCGEYELSKVYEYLRRLVQELDKGIMFPSIIFNENDPLDFAPYTIEGMPGVVHNYASISEVCNLFYAEKFRQSRLESMKTSLRRRIRNILDKAYKKLMYQEGDFTHAHENEKYRLYGELLTTYAYQLKKGEQEALLTDFYTGKEVAVPLEPRYTPIENAQRYFKIYNKSKRAITHLEELMKANRAEINYLESVLVAIEQAEDPADVDEVIYELEKGGYLKAHQGKQTKKQVVKGEPRRFLSSNGLEILVGRNNRQNDILTLKQSDRHDLWLHTKDIPGTHVIVRLPAALKDIDDIPDATLEEAASLAAYFSKASEAEKVPVDYTFRSNVRKPAGAKPGMVIYDNYWTILVNPHSPLVQNLLASNQRNQVVPE